MDLQKKLNTIKQKIKDNRREIIAVSTVAAVTTVAIIVKRSLRDGENFHMEDTSIAILNDADEIGTVMIMHDDLAEVRTGNTDLRFSLDGDDFVFKHLGRTKFEE